jgi:starvation-inducible DNA-binding protein
MGAISSPLTDDARTVTGEALQGSLIDLIDLSLLAKQAHWNLVGRHFRSLHLQLDEVVAMARAHSDTIAERAVAIGANPDGRSGTVAERTEVPQLPDGYLQDDKVVEAFTGIFASIIERSRDRLGVVAEADPVTENILEEVLHGLEKMYWMFQAMR